MSLGVWLVLAGGLAAAGPAAAAAPLPRLGPAPNFALTAPRNDRVWLAQLRGRVVVLTFTCTRCEAACPRLVPTLADLARSLGERAGRRVFFVAVSVDPELDTPAVLRRFGRDRRLEPPAWLLLTGAPAEVEVVTRRYGVGVRRAEGAVTHDCVALLVDAGGTLRARHRPPGSPAP